MTERPLRRPTGRRCGGTATRRPRCTRRSRPAAATVRRIHCGVSSTRSAGDIRPGPGPSAPRLPVPTVSVSASAAAVGRFSAVKGELTGRVSPGSSKSILVNCLFIERHRKNTATHQEHEQHEPDQAGSDRVRVHVAGRVDGRAPLRAAPAISNSVCDINDMAMAMCTPFPRSRTLVSQAVGPAPNTPAPREP